MSSLNTISYTTPANPSATNLTIIQPNPAFLTLLLTPLAILFLATLTTLQYY